MKGGDMNTVELIKALGDAAAAAKPPQEYCLFGWDTWVTCMTKAEWASWVQALGAIAAIGGAARIASRQERNARVAAKRLGVRKARTALAGLLAVAELLREKGSMWIADAVPKRRLAEEHLNIARSIEADQLHLSWTMQVIAIRSLGVQLVSAIERFERSQPRKNDAGLAEQAAYDQLLEAVGHVEGELEKVQEAISAQHPGIDAYDE